jgi:hypothetical protein
MVAKSASRAVLSAVALFGLLKLACQDLGIAIVSAFGRFIFKEEDRIHKFLELFILHCPKAQASVYKLRAMKL